MTRIIFLTFFIVLKGSYTNAQDNTNLIVIVLDDLGYGDLGYMGCSDISTPTIDSLQKRAIEYTNFYANSPVCSPSRAALLTGLHPNNNGILGVLRGHHDSTGLDPNIPTLASILKSNGYACGLVGKWHLGIAEDSRPQKFGFDYSYGPLSGMVDYYSYIGNGGMDGQRNLFENNIEVFDSGYLTNLITEKSVDFIERHIDQKFLLNINYTAPHRPIQVDSQRYESKDLIEALSPRAKYLSMIESVDSGIRKIFYTLRQKGLDQNTIVVLTNDHGWPAHNQSSREISSNKNLSGGKYFLYEGGIKIPFLLSAPWIKGHKDDQLGSLMDLLPTVLHLLNIEYLPSSFDGISLFNTNIQPRDKAQRTLFWRFEDSHTPLQKAIRKDRWKLLIMNDVFALFDLENDPGEKRDLHEHQPDVVDRLYQEYERWEKSVRYLSWNNGE